MVVAAVGAIPTVTAAVSCSATGELFTFLYHALIPPFTVVRSIDPAIATSIGPSIALTTCVVGQELVMSFRLDSKIKSFKDPLLTRQERVFF